MGRLLQGMTAGAVGTALLNATTYLDMAVRGRPASEIPGAAVDHLLARLGRSLEGDDPRREGLGTLMGFVTGVFIGAVYGAVRPSASGVPRGLAIPVVGLGAMAATDSGNVLLGLTDPREWSAQDWAADVIPHLAFGAGVVLAFDALRAPG